MVAAAGKKLQKSEGKKDYEMAHKLMCMKNAWNSPCDYCKDLER